MLKKGFFGPPPVARRKAVDKGKSIMEEQRPQADSSKQPHMRLVDLAPYLDLLDLELIKCYLGEESCFDSPDFQKSFKDMVESLDNRFEDWDFNLEIPKLLSDMAASSKGTTSTSSWMNSNGSNNWCMKYDDGFQRPINTIKEDLKFSMDVEMGEPPPATVSDHRHRHAKPTYSRLELLQLRSSHTPLSSIVKEDLHQFVHGPKPVDLSCSEKTYANTNTRLQSWIFLLIFTQIARKKLFSKKITSLLDALFSNQSPSRLIIISAFIIQIATLSLPFINCICSKLCWSHLPRCRKGRRKRRRKRRE